MKKLLSCLLVVISGVQGYDMDDWSAFNTPLPAKEEKEVAGKDCWRVCHKRLVKVEKLQIALDFYRNSPYYSFSSSFSKKRSK